MKGLLKVIGALLGILVLLVIGFGIYLFTQLDTLVEDVIEEQGTAATGTKVAVDGVKIEIADARGTIDGLSVANPQGYAAGSALTLGRLSLQIDPGSVNQDVVVIKDVAVTGTRVALEQTTSGSNLKAIMDHVQRQAGGSTSDSSETPKIIIEKLTIDDTLVSVSLPQAGEAREITVPKIVVNDIGRATNGATAAEVAKQVLDPLIQRALRSAAAEEIKGRVDEKLDEAKDKLKNSLLDKLGG